MIDRSTHLLLGQVVAVADAVLNRPALLRDQDFRAVMSELKRRHERPSEHGKRRTHFAMMLMDALMHVIAARGCGDSDAVKWEMIAATIVPCVKADIPHALEDERRELADTH
jgi:hypothetical protein